MPLGNGEKGALALKLMIGKKVKLIEIWYKLFWLSALTIILLLLICGNA
jgi:hypothetical protein